MWNSYELDATVLKSSDALVLCRSEKASVEIGKDALAVAVKCRDEKAGYVFLGQGRLTVDTIVETEEGAVGKPVERKLDQPFLMLGRPDEVAPRLSPATNEDFKRMGVAERKFLDEARNLVDLFGRKRTVHGHEHFGGSEGSIFVFRDDGDRLDTLLLRGSKLIFKAEDMAFVSNAHHSVLKSSGQIVVSHNGRCVVVKRPFGCHIHC